MKCTLPSALGVALLASNVAAFPRAAINSLSPEALAKLMKPRELSQKRDAVGPQGAGALPLTPPPFDPVAQLVDVTGEHAFVAPTSSDDRGPCPGLNAMANHGYLPHNGKATIAQLVEGTGKVFGMGVDLATFLAVFGAVFDGDGLGWSIGGTVGTGIGGSHGNYETDSSPFKGDLYQYGSNTKLVLSQFENFLDRQPGDASANYNLEVLRDFRAHRFQESIEKNPYFSYQVFTGTLVSQAAFTFIYRFMSNKTAEAPEGILNRDVLKSFNSISGSGKNLAWTFGHERIPKNWYKRNDVAAYTIPYFLTDVLYLAESHPEILGLGCNTGTVNSFNTITASAASNGAYTTKQALTDPVCFATEFVLAEAPSQLGPVAAKLTSLTNALTKVATELKCSQKIGSVNQTAVAFCPGATLYGGPNANVAPGAIQT